MINCTNKTLWNVSKVALWRKKNKMPLKILFKAKTPAFPNGESLKSACIYFCSIFGLGFRKHQVNVTNSVSHSPSPLCPPPPHPLRGIKNKIILRKIHLLQRAVLLTECSYKVRGLFFLCPYWFRLACMYVFVYLSACSYLVHSGIYLFSRGD